MPDENRPSAVSSYTVVPPYAAVLGTSGPAPGSLQVAATSVWPGHSVRLATSRSGADPPSTRAGDTPPEAAGLPDAEQEGNAPTTPAEEQVGGGGPHWPEAKQVAQTTRPEAGSAPQLQGLGLQSWP